MVELEPQQISEFVADHELIRNPSLYLLNTRLFLNDLSRLQKKPVHMIDVPDQIWQEMAQKYDGIWFMGIYEESKMARASALNYQHEYTEALPDLREQDIVGSPFSIRAYRPDQR